MKVDGEGSKEDKSGEDRRLGVTEGRTQVRSSTAVHKARAAATERLEEGVRTSPYWVNQTDSRIVVS
jgi:hypothetical protein